MLANQTYATQMHSLQSHFIAHISLTGRHLIVGPPVVREHDFAGLHSKPRAHFTKFRLRQNLLVPTTHR